MSDSVPTSVLHGIHNCCQRDNKRFYCLPVFVTILISIVPASISIVFVIVSTAMGESDN